MLIVTKHKLIKKNANKIFNTIIMYIQLFIMLFLLKINVKLKTTDRIFIDSNLIQ
jgi:hypothetical protein